MKTFMVIYDGKSYFVNGDKVTTSNGVIYIDDDCKKNVATISGSAMVIDVTSIDNEEAEKHKFKFSIG